MHEINIKEIYYVQDRVIITVGRGKKDENNGRGEGEEKEGEEEEGEEEEGGREG